MRWRTHRSSPPHLLVLYARSDALGDALMRIPAVRAARSAFPAARIVYGTTGTTHLSSTLRRHLEGVVDEFLPDRTLPRLLRELGPRRGHAAVADFRTVAGWLARERLRLLPSGIAYDANFPGYALTPGRGLGVRPEHNAWRYHRVVERLAGRSLPFDHRLDVLPSARTEVERIRNGSRRPLALLAGNSAAHKALRAVQLAPVAEHLMARGHDVVYLHSPGDGATGAEMTARVPGITVVGGQPDLNGVPLLDVFQALGEQAAAYVGPEGGLGHWMATVLTPIVIVNHGASMDRWRPLSGLVEVVEARTASASGRNMHTPPATIIAAVDRLLAAQQRNHPARDRALPAA